MDNNEFQSAKSPDQDWLSIQKFRNGDKSAFREIFDRHKSRVINLAFRFTRSREVSEDIAQEIFIKIYEGKVPRDLRAKFTTWLYRVTVNASIDYIRSRKFTPVSIDVEKEGDESGKPALPEGLKDIKALSPGEILKQEEIKTLIQKEIGRLPEKFRSPILLYQFKDLSYREIAKILNITEKAVERRLYHAKEILRKNLGGLL